MRASAMITLAILLIACGGTKHAPAPRPELLDHLEPWPRGIGSR